MKAIKLIALASGVALAGGLAGCGPSAEERAASQKRFELEAQAQLDAQKANTAITNMNQKLGRKPPQLDLGLPPATQTKPASDQPKQP